MMGDTLSDAAGGISTTSISTSQAAISSAKIESKLAAAAAAAAGSMDETTGAVLTAIVGVAALSKYKKGISNNTGGTTQALLTALGKATPTSGHPNQLMHVLDDGTKILFRKDFGQEAHPLGGPLQGQGNINHYNIQIQKTNGKTIENMHIIPNSNGGLTILDKNGKQIK